MLKELPQDPRKTLRGLSVPISALCISASRAVLQTSFKGVLAVIGALPSLALAQDNFPIRPIRMIVPVTPGGMVDTSTRVIAERLGQRLGQSIVLEHRPGASGFIGSELVAKAPPDGYTLLAGFDGPLTMNPNIARKVPFDPVRDFQPITKLGDAALVLVAHPSFKANTLAELIAQKATIGRLSYGTSGTGGPNHVAGELMKQLTGLDLVHVPYKGGGQAILDGIAGQIPLVYTAVAGAQQYVKTGKLKALGVSSRERSSSLPDTPTFIEAGLADFIAESWTGILAPANTPRSIVERLRSEILAVTALPEVRERFAAIGMVRSEMTPEQFGAQLKSDLERWGAVIRKAGIKED